MPKKNNDTNEANVQKKANGANTIEGITRTALNLWRKEKVNKYLCEFKKYNKDITKNCKKIEEPFFINGVLIGFKLAGIDPSKGEKLSLFESVNKKLLKELLLNPEGEPDKIVIKKEAIYAEDKNFIVVIRYTEGNMQPTTKDGKKVPFECINATKVHKQIFKEFTDGRPEVNDESVKSELEKLVKDPKNIMVSNGLKEVIHNNKLYIVAEEKEIKGSKLCEVEPFAIEVEVWQKNNK